MKLLTGTALAVAMATPAMAQDDMRIGVSMTSFDNPWLAVVLGGMQGEAEATEGLSLTVEDAEQDVGQQLNQVQNFIASGADAIIVNPVDGDSTEAMTRQAEQAGIPLVYVNHPPYDIDALPDNSAYVGSDETQAARMETAAICGMLETPAIAVIMMGPLANHAAITRTEVTKETLADTPACAGVEVVEEQTANWSRVEARDLMSSWLTAGVQPDAVIANNDEMAIGAAQALKTAGVDMDEVVIGGIDATADGLAAMEAGDLDVTVFQDGAGQGRASVETAVALARGEDRPQAVWIPFEPVTPENMDQYVN